MQLHQIFLLLTAAISANACQYYTTSQQDGAATQHACGRVSGASFNDVPHHQCNKGGDGVQNCGWEDECNDYSKTTNNGKTYYQWCWNKVANVG
ncbi:hypothetical protein CLAFUW4_13532 [Fulvia fulva]|uniref:Secreted protein n=1 Tax=Passalora fulva TaxID=5499 RepID=A0A9Q8UVX6_PASFU|nr:uncharacterized protein CLAFUR5_13383 [Fulvia fulva]KAK4610086.1 hypothetical protein CLAFUR4_13534 [Fulvia fulva]KAK4611433.1 hypothetical protein CLAFUR0_13543 [Fulvia fulva]UJO24312.1 hypothetical protein CLAFUR5_13383 [Fulvia fulva]WPV21859.1 hypothetical protein CLAFUW4_13532 [Fulvia fulva]WPV37212.1 hypothetical protein CLAFUW7_13539 [Fulvia fulva]